MIWFLLLNAIRSMCRAFFHGTSPIDLRVDLGGEVYQLRQLIYLLFGEIGAREMGEERF